MRSNNTQSDNSTQKRLDDCSKRLLCIGISAAFAMTSPSVFAQDKKAEERWFEIEVILFSQLAQKTIADEQFPNTTQVPLMRNRSRALELLTPYLQPDLSLVKTSLKGCLATHDEIDFVEKWQPEPIFELSKFLIEYPNFENPELDITWENSELFESLKARFNPQPEPESDNDLLNDSFGELDPFNNGFNRAEDSSALSLNENSSSELESNLDNNFDQFENENLNENQAFLEQEPIEEQTLLTPEEIDGLVEQVKLALIEQDAVTQQALRLDNLWRIKKLNCLLPGEVFNWQQMLALSPEPEFDFTIGDSFDVISVPPRVHGSEPIWQDEPYLISSDSLKLKKLAQRLRNSRNFRPLLHIGWRQPGLPKNQALPVHLYAGDNLELAYQHELDAALKARQEAAEAEQAEIENIEISYTGQSTEIALPADQLVLDELLTEVTNDSLPATSDLLERLAPDYHWPSSSQEDDVPLPVAPKQNWYLDGLFKVHLNHYLFITADFNVMEKPLSDINYNSEEDRQIRFVQNRRVISKEIHYFDHPYMGMIVQIRRYSRPEPEEKTND